MKKNKGNFRFFILLISTVSLSLIAIYVIPGVMHNDNKKGDGVNQAFQNASNGIEWAMTKIKNAKSGEKVVDIFGKSASAGEVTCPSELSGSNGSCRITLLKREDENSGMLNKIAGNIPISQVDAISSEGVFEEGNEKVSRIMEAHAMVTEIQRIIRYSNKFTLKRGGDQYAGFVKCKDDEVVVGCIRHNKDNNGNLRNLTDKNSSGYGKMQMNIFMDIENNGCYMGYNVDRDFSRFIQVGAVCLKHVIDGGVVNEQL